MSQLEPLVQADIYKEIAELAANQGITSQADWDNLVHEVVDSHLNLGELDPDQPIEELKEALNADWDRYEREAGEESPTQIDQDPEDPHL